MLMLRWILGLVVLVFASQAHAVISFDAASSTTCGAVSSVSWSHTCTGCDFLAVGITVRDNASTTISSVTYNGAALTFIGQNNSSFMRAWLYYMKAPATGTNTVAITFGGSLSVGCAVGGVSLAGVDQTSPIGVAASGNGVSSTPSISLTPVDPGIGWGVDVITSLTSAPTEGSAQTERWEQLDGLNNYGAMSTLPFDSDPDTMDWTLSGSLRWALVGVEVNAATSTGRRRGASLY